MSYFVDFNNANSEQIERALLDRLETIRLARNLTQAQLATMTGLSLRTMNRLGKGDGTTLDTFIRVLTALGLQASLATLLPDPSDRPVERMEKGRERRRVRTLSTSTPTGGTWQRADDEPARN
jgi:putative transcriptional regulator